MILAIDVGNTNTVLGCLKGDHIEFTLRIRSDRDKTADEYLLLIDGLLRNQGVDPASLEGGILSSVVPELRIVMKNAMERLTGKSFLAVGTGIKTGLDIRTDNPAQLGADLVVDAVAALAKYKPPLVIFDMGTATTIGVISEGRNYEGGMLLPGVNVSLEALSRRAAQLPAISLQHPKVLIGKTTEDCMRSGIVYGTAGMLDGVIDRIREQFSGRTLSVVATGGNAPVIVKYCRNKIVYDKYLLMDGLWAIYQKNK